MMTNKIFYKRQTRKIRVFQRAPDIFPAECEHDQQQQGELEAAAPADKSDGGERLEQNGGIEQRRVRSQHVSAQRQRAGGAQAHADQADQHHQIEIAKEEEDQQHEMEEHEELGSPG